MQGEGGQNAFDTIFRFVQSLGTISGKISDTNLDSGVVAVQDGRVEVALNADIVACNVMQPHIETYRTNISNMNIHI